MSHVLEDLGFWRGEKKFSKCVLCKLFKNMLDLLSAVKLD